MPADNTQSAPEIRWTWSSKSYGGLSTIIRPDGSITQERQYSPKSNAVVEEIGKVSADDVQRLQELAATALASENPSAAGESPPDAEVFDLQLIDATDATDGAGARAARVARAAIESHPAMAQLREAIIRARHRAGGGYFSYHNVGARLAFVYIAVMIFTMYLTLSGKRDLSRLQRDAQRIDATVTERHGSNGFDKYKYLMVHFIPTGGVKGVDAKVTEYLSAENWRAAKPGVKVRVWYLPATGKACLEDDLMRNIREGSGFGLFPLIFSAGALPLIWFFSRYRADAYSDGKEYMIHGDRVSLDGKAMPFSDSELLAVRALIRLAS